MMNNGFGSITSFHFLFQDLHDRLFSIRYRFTSKQMSITVAKLNA